MLIHELSAEECADHLGRTSVGRLACALFHQPYIVPIHFSFDAERGCLYAFSMVGQKIEWMRQNPLVCLEFDELTTHGQWASVVVFGHYEELPPTPVARRLDE